MDVDSQAPIRLGFLTASTVSDKLCPPVNDIALSAVSNCQAAEFPRNRSGYRGRLSNDTARFIGHHIRIVVVLKLQVPGTAIRQWVGQRVVIQHHRVLVADSTAPRITNFLMINLYRVTLRTPSRVTPHGFKDGNTTRVGCRTVRNNPRQRHHVQVPTVVNPPNGLLLDSPTQPNSAAI